MIYRVLVVGNDTETQDVFFNELSDNYFLCSASERSTDIGNHITFFNPELVLFCIRDTSDEMLAVYSKLRRKLERAGSSVGVVGYGSDCEKFQMKTEMLAKLIIHRPADSKAMDSEIQSFMAEVEAKKQSKAKPSEPEKKVIPQVKPIQRDPNRRARILAVDDEPLMLKLIQEQLSDRYDVSTAINGKLALKFLEKKTTDLILLDYEMPVENGAEVLAKIRSNPETAGIPVIFLTGVTDQEKIKQVISYKPQGYILKPLNRDKLLEAIEKYV